MPRLEGQKTPVTRVMTIVLTLLILALGAYLLYDQYQRRSGNTMDQQTSVFPAQTSAAPAGHAHAA